MVAQCKITNFIIKTLFIIHLQDQFCHVYLGSNEIMVLGGFFMCPKGVKTKGNDTNRYIVPLLDTALTCLSAWIPGVKMVKDPANCMKGNTW